MHFVSRLTRAALLGSLLTAPLALALSPADLAGRLARNDRVLVIDVRPATAFAEGHIPGAINIPLSLLPHKQVPASQPVIVCGDGLGVVDDAKAANLLRTRPGLNVDVLEGGYAAWLAHTRISTAPGGVTREKLPGITYDQLVNGGKGDVLLVDLRSSASTAPAAAAAADGKSTRPLVAARRADPVEDFGRKLGVPVVAPRAAAAAAATSARAGAPTVAASREASGTGPVSAAAAVEGLDRSGKLLVLVADDETEANEAARQLRARGYYRFTVLIGGTEAIRHEGRTGSGRMDGAATPIQR